MTNTAQRDSNLRPTAASQRAGNLADRLEQGAEALATFAAGISDAAWSARIPGDGRKVGVIVHHVASVYPIEIQLAQAAAKGQPVTGVVWDTVHQMNAGHAKDNELVTKTAAVDLLRQNSATAADAIRALSDEELDGTVTVSLYDDAPLTCQFILEDHAVRHSYHHLAVMKRRLAEAGLI
jgi:hypothetical protein